MKQDVIELDGVIGGGQVLRSGVSLSMVTGRTLCIRNIRAKRSRPGLMRQHLTAVLAAAQVCGARVEGAELGSQTLRFAPGRFKAATTALRLARRAVAPWCCKRCRRRCCRH